MSKKHPVFEKIVFIFQGGGALGSYQAGVFQALHENGYEPDWIIGNSIGAMNASIIAGNNKEDWLNKLSELWTVLSKPVPTGLLCDLDKKIPRTFYNYLSSQFTLWMRQTGFFYPRLQSPLLNIKDTVDKISFYITDPLAETLESLINFEILNRGQPRLTLSAVDVHGGCPVYFDNTQEKLDYRHIMASGALPPGFPAVKIGSNYYWDSGILTNAPLERLMEECAKVNTLCFIVNLFDSQGLSPTSLDGVLKRHKDITYSSHYLYLLRNYRENLRLRKAISALYNQLPVDVQEKAENKVYEKYSLNGAVMHFVHFIYQANHHELSSLDYDFSNISVKERFKDGYVDGLRAIQSKPWEQAVSEQEAIFLHEVHCHRDPINIWDEKNQFF